MCYRRSDSADVAGRIYDRLVLEFGKEAVYRDVDAIPYGVDFREHIRGCLGACSIGLVVIGPEWTSVTGQTGQPRLSERADHVRAEVEAMLARPDIAIIPLLVRGASFPEAETMPPSIHDLAFRNGPEIRRDPDFHADVDRLVRQMRMILPQPEPVQKEVWKVAKEGLAIVAREAESVSQPAMKSARSGLLALGHSLSKINIRSWTGTTFRYARTLLSKINVRLIGTAFRYVVTAWRESWIGQKLGERLAMIMLAIIGIGVFFVRFLDSIEVYAIAAASTPVVLAFWNLIRKRFSTAWILLCAAQPAAFAFFWANELRSLVSGERIFDMSTLFGTVFTGTLTVVYAVSVMILLVWIPPFLRYPEDRFHLANVFAMRHRERKYAVVALVVSALFILPYFLVLAGYNFGEIPYSTGNYRRGYGSICTLATTLIIPFMAGLTFARERARWAVQYLFVVLVSDSIGLVLWGLSAIAANVFLHSTVIAEKWFPWLFIAFHVFAVFKGIRVIRRTRPTD